MPLKHLYTAGLAGNEFLHGLKKGQILSTACQHCGVTYVPSRHFCERCLGDISGNRRAVSAQGELVCWTLCHVDRRGRRTASCRIVGAVRLYGATTTLVHFLNVPRSRLKSGLKLEAAFKPESRRTGSVLDIRHFRLR